MIKIKLNEKSNDYYRCNCSICKRKGSITTIVDKKDLEIVKGVEKIKFYQFNTKTEKHFFCSICGINTHNLRRSDPNTYGVNVGCLEDISTKELFEFKVRVNDGKKMEVFENGEFIFAFGRKFKNKIDVEYNGKFKIFDVKKKNTR